MSEESTGMDQRAKSFVDQAKRSMGAGEAPLATEAGGRSEGMREALKAFGEGDIDRFLSAFADDVEWAGPNGDGFPGAGNHQGRDAVRDGFVADAERSYASFGFRPERYLESPGENVVVALGAFIGEGVKGTGQLDAPAVQVWEYDGDKVVAVAIYTDSAAFPGVVTEQEQKEREEEKEGGADDEGGDEDKDEPQDRGEGDDEPQDRGDREDKDRDQDKEKDR